MSKTSLYRLSALAGILSGVSIILGKLLIPLPNRQIGEIFDFFSPFLALLFLVGLYLGQRRESGVFGGIAFIVLFFGLATVVSLDYFGAFIAPYLPDGMVDQLLEGPTSVVFVISGLTFIIGEILFGISVIRAGVYSKIAAVLFIAGMFPIPLAGIFPESVVVTGSITAGVGLVWWGFELYRLANSKSDPE
ncbi:hypothetical protein ACFLXI_08915 [Chloroflexota bacterium]